MVAKFIILRSFSNHTNELVAYTTVTDLYHFINVSKIIATLFAVLINIGLSKRKVIFYHFSVF